MRFVDDIDFIGAAGGPELYPLDDLARVLDAGVRGGVHLDHVHGVPPGDRDAGLALATWAQRLLGGAVDRLGQQPRHGGLADAARPGEQVGMRDPALGQGVAECLDDMFLADQLVEGL